MTNWDERRRQFAALHERGIFVMPNPHDQGACRLLSSLGFLALATTSGGMANSMGRLDMTTTRNDLIEHVRLLTSCTELPISVDAEQCFPKEPGGVSECINLLAEAGAAGVSIEDWSPQLGSIESTEAMVKNVREAAEAAHLSGLTLTARAENHLHGVSDLDDTVARLRAYRAAGADVLYAPGLVQLDQIESVVTKVDGPINVLLRPGGPNVEQLQEIGVRRISVGSSLAQIAYGAFYNAALALRDDGVLNVSDSYLNRAVATDAFSNNAASQI